MTLKTTLTELEIEIMDVIWKNGEQSITQVTDLMEDSHGLARNTIKMYIRRLVDKGILGMTRLRGNNYKYYALMTKEEYEAFKLDTFLINNKQGLKHLVASMIRTNEFSDDEINEVEDIIKQYKNNGE